MKNKALLVGISLLLVVGVGVFLFMDSSPDNQAVTQQPTATPTPRERMDSTATPTPTSGQSMTINDRYVDYSASTFAQYRDSKRVLFFHAGWCPTCIAANTAFENNSDDIPEDVVVLKTDYDNETELKNKYGITYQHTFVQVDTNGNEITKWNGGDIDQLLSKIQ